MAVTVTQIATFKETSAQATSRTTPAFSSGVPVGDLVIVAGTVDGWTLTTVADTKSNTWTRTINQAQGGATSAYLAWTVVASGKALTTSDTVTLTVGGAATFAFDVQWVSAGSAFAASPLDNSGAAGVATGTSVSSGAVAMANATDVLWGVNGLEPSTSSWSNTGTGTWTAVTTEDLVATIASGVRRADMYWQSVSSSGSYTYSGNTTATQLNSAAGIAGFILPGGGPTLPPDLIMAPPHR